MQMQLFLKMMVDGYLDLMAVELPLAQQNKLCF